MTLDFSPAGGWLEAVDGLESITWKRPGSSREETIVQALRRPRKGSSRSRWAGDSRSDQAVQHEVVWHVAKSSMTGVPQIGDTLTDTSQTVWTIIDVEDVASSETWRCGARNAIAYYALDDFVDIEKSEATLTTSGAEELIWNKWRTGVPARWGERSTKSVQREERLDTERLATVFILAHTLLDATQRIRRPDGTTFQILACEVPDSPDQPSEVRVRPTPATDSTFE